MIVFTQRRLYVSCQGREMALINDRLNKLANELYQLSCQIRCGLNLHIVSDLQILHLV